MKIYTENNLIYLILDPKDSNSSWEELFKQISRETNCDYDWLKSEFVNLQGVSDFSEIRVSLGDYPKFLMPTEFYDYYSDYEQSVLKRQDQFLVNSLFQNIPNHLSLVSREQFELLSDLISYYESENPNQSILEMPNLVNEILEQTFMDQEVDEEGISLEAMEILKENFDEQMFGEWFLFFENNSAAEVMFVDRNLYPLPADLDKDIINISAKNEMFTDSQESISILDLYEMADDGLAIETILEIENRDNPERLKFLKEQNKKFENEWVSRFKEINFENLSDDELIAGVQKIIDPVDWHLSGVDSNFFFSNLSRSDLMNLFLLSAIHSFFEEHHFRYSAGSKISNILGNGYFDCNTSSFYVQNLMQLIGIEDFTYNLMPAHAVLGYKTTSNVKVYLDNGTHLLPEEYYRLPRYPSRLSNEGDREVTDALITSVLEHDEDVYHLKVRSDVDDEIRKEILQNKINIFKKVIILQPDHAFFYQAIGTCYFQLSILDGGTEKDKTHYKNESIRYFEKAIKVNDVDPDIYFEYSKLYFYYKEYSKGVDLVVKAYELNPDSNYDLDYIILPLKYDGMGLSDLFLDDQMKNYALGVLYYLSKSPDALNKSEEYLEMAYDSDPENVRFIQAYSKLFVEKYNQELLYGTEENAIQYIDKAIEIDSENAAAWYARSGWFWLQGDTKQAVNLVKKALLLDPNHTAYKARYALYIAGEDFERSQNLLQEAYQSKSYDKTVLLMMYYNSMVIGDYELAETQISAARKMYPNDGEIIIYQSELEAIKGNFHSSRSDFEDIIQQYSRVGQAKDSNSLIIRFLMRSYGKILFLGGDYDDAYKVFEKYVPSDSDDLFITGKLLRLSIDLNNKEVSKWYETLKEINFVDDLYYQDQYEYYMSLAYYEWFYTNNFEKGSVYANKAYEILPHAINSRIYKLYANSEIDSLEKLAMENPKNFESRWLLGNYFEKTGEKEKTLFYFQEALALQSSNQIVKRKMFELQDYL